MRNVFFLNIHIVLLLLKLIHLNLKVVVSNRISCILIKLRFYFKNVSKELDKEDATTISKVQY